MLSNGEFVMRAAAVSAFGLNFMHAINAGMVPAGFAPAVPRFSSGGAVSGSSSTLSPGNNAEMTINLNIGGQAHRVQSSRETALSLASALRDLARVGL
jgi:hypothetical protein